MPVVHLHPIRLEKVYDLAYQSISGRLYLHIRIYTPNFREIAWISLLLTFFRSIQSKLGSTSKLTPSVWRYTIFLFSSLLAPSKVFSSTTTEFIPGTSLIMIVPSSFYITFVIRNFFRLRETFTVSSAEFSEKVSLLNS